jgi:hypothetical protein
MEMPKAKLKVSQLRVVLNSESGICLQGWMDQLVETYPGIHIKKQDLVNWLVSEKGGRLSPNDLKAVKDRFFDDIALAEWALRELKSARARNENLVLLDLLKDNGPDPVRKIRRQKCKNEPPQNEGPELASPKLEPIATFKGDK